MRKKVFTDSVLAEIRRWISESGLGAAEIAEKIGCTVGTLRVLCSHYGISLRKPSRSRQPCHAGPTRDPALPDVTLNLSDDTRVRLQERAALLGLSDADLVSMLIEAIDRDDLYSAVLDDSR
jgi:hypothetical protein